MSELFFNLFPKKQQQKKCFASPHLLIVLSTMRNEYNTERAEGIIKCEYLFELFYLLSFK
jgi:hypothetical protein